MEEEAEMDRQKFLMDENEKQELIRLEQEHQVHENIIFPNEK